MFKILLENAFFNFFIYMYASLLISLNRHIQQMFKALVQLLKKVQGRDKLTKFLIYLFKLTDAIRSFLRKRPTYRMQRIAIHFQRARQFMRLGKSLLEYQQAVTIIQRQTKDEFGRLVRIILHAIFSFYWALDNLSLAASFGLIQIPQFQISQSAMTIKFIGMCIAAIFNLRTWTRLHYQQLKARRQMRGLSGQQHLCKDKEMMGLIVKQWKMFLLCLKILADMLPTIARSALAKKILKIKIPRALQALGGLINASVSCLIAAH